MSKRGLKIEYSVEKIRDENERCSTYIKIVEREREREISESIITFIYQINFRDN